MRGIIVVMEYNKNKIFEFIKKLTLKREHIVSDKEFGDQDKAFIFFDELKLNPKHIFGIERDYFYNVVDDPEYEINLFGIEGFNGVFIAHLDLENEIEKLTWEGLKNEENLMEKTFGRKKEDFLKHKIQKEIKLKNVFNKKKVQDINF